jgi:two-component system cell cycle sensor histidine kinase/response regulator CckA
LAQIVAPPLLVFWSMKTEPRESIRVRQLSQELVIRGGVALLIIAFQIVAHVARRAEVEPLVLVPALLALLLNGSYYLAAGTGRWFRAQAYARMLGDIGLITVGLYGAGGLGAAPYLGVYLIVTIYTGFVFSSTACVVATAAATASYLALVMLQQIGVLALPSRPLPDAPAIAAFNLIVLNVAGVLAAVLARALRESRRRLRAAHQELQGFVEAIPDVIYVLDRDGRLARWNRRLEVATGLSARDLAGRPLVELLAEDGRAAMREALARGAADGRFEVETRLRGADGTPVPYQWTGAALTDERGQVSGLTGVGRDVTERSLTEEALRHRESELRRLQRIEAVGRLAGGVAHDFNNLLTVIIGRCQLLLFRHRPDDPVRADLDLIESTAQRAANLTRQLLAFSRKQTLAVQVLNLNGVVAGVTAMLRPIIGENVELAVALEPRIGSVTADPGQLEQVIVNLAVNARDAMPSGGRLHIETRDVELDLAFTRVHPDAGCGPHVLLEVSDTGVGMDEETRQRVFEPFFTTKEADQGTGLGLSTVYGIVKQHGGYVAVESAPGRGATFRIYLPRTEAAPARAPRHETDGSAAPGGEDTILLVEDKDEVRRLVRELLGRLGYQVLAARNGADAVELSRRFPGPIHLLLTDIVMPGMTGRELAERLRATRPDTPALFTSGHVSEVLNDDALLLQKPFTLETLARKVAAALRRPAPPRPDDRPDSRTLAEPLARD